MSSFSFIHITDHHIPEEETQLVHGFSPGYAFRKVMHHIAEHTASRVDFIACTGDLVEPTSELAYQTFCNLVQLKAISPAPGPQLISLEGLEDFPIYFLPGNHDERPLFSRHLFSVMPPTGLANFTFQHHGVQFICLDWGGQAKAVLYQETLDHLTHALEVDLPSVILMHHHALPVGSRWLDEFIADDVERFWETVTGHEVMGIFTGHVHITYEEQVDGIPVYGLRSTAFPFARVDEPLLTLQPPHYRLVSIQDNILTTRVFEVAL